MTRYGIRIGLAIVKLFPNGGLQRDCIAIYRRLSALGHSVKIICTSSVMQPDDLDVVILKNRAVTNHGRNLQFARDLRRFAGGNFDTLIGFDALDGLDFLYCANPPVRSLSLLDRLNPRKRTLMQLERACFGSASKTKLLMLSDVQRDQYDRRWHLDPSRVAVLPPTIERSRIILSEHKTDVRMSVRKALGLGDQDDVWLFVGSFPKTKGLDRLIMVLSQFPTCKLLCVGCGGKNIARFGSLAQRVGVHDQILWLGIRSDVSELMAAADLLIHPSRLDVTGTVILEALANGLPVITTSVCGYAPHVRLANAGRIIDEPFLEQKLVEALKAADDKTARAKWSRNAVRYSDSTDLFSGLDVAVETILKS